MQIVFHPRYDIHCFGLERLHPFDACKYGRAWKLLKKSLGKRLSERHVRVDRPASDQELLLAHSAEHLKRTRSAKEIAAAVELPVLRRVPGWVLRQRLVTPMRWAVRGTYLAGKTALQNGLAMNLSGGYHHAKPDRGEGFCLFNDIAVMVRQLRRDGSLAETGRIAYVDLDAHQGNGVCHEFLHEPQVFLFDMYNGAIYPCGDETAQKRIDCNVPLSPGCAGGEYLEILRMLLPAFLDSISRTEPLALGICNAGTDVLAGDPLGGLSLSADDVLDRDQFVIGQFRDRRVPLVVLPSGGYTSESHRLIAMTAERSLSVL